MSNKISAAMLLMMLFLVISAPPSYAGSHGWMIYYEGSFKGKIIDAETKEPIEGAVVVAIYHVRLFGPILPIFSDSVVADVQEVLTNSNGEFNISSNIFFYPWPTTLGGEQTNFIIFKPGYGSFPDYPHSPSGLRPIDEEIFFSKDAFGKEGELELWVKGEKKPELKKFKLPFGLIELPKLKTREERLKAMPSPVGEDSDYKKQKLFIQLINEERKNLGLKGQYKID